MSDKEKSTPKKSILNKTRTLKSKVKHIKDVMKKSKFPSSDFENDDNQDETPSKSASPKKVRSVGKKHHTELSGSVKVISQNQGDVKSLESERSDKLTEDSETEVKTFKYKTISNKKSNITPTTSKDSSQPPSPRKSPALLSKSKKFPNTDSKKTLNEGQSSTSKIIPRRRPRSAGDRGRYFPTEFMKDYCKQVGRTSFSLPEDEYRDLMHLKTDAERKMKITNAQLNKTMQEFEGPPLVGENVRVKCFSQITQRLEVNPVDGSITSCYLNNQFLVIIQKNRINAYSKKDNPRDWTIKDTMVRLKFENVVHELIIPCLINKKETLVFCEVYLLRDPRSEKWSLKMAQYRFLNENGKMMKDFHLGTFDCDLGRFVSIAINRRLCTIAVAAWANQQQRAVAWIFTHTSVTDSMRCTPMIPVKHECMSLHDVSVVTTKTMMLGFGSGSFTVWNGKSGERLIFVNMHKLAPMEVITCHFGLFAVIQKGFLFLVVSAKSKLHMIAINMGTGLYKSLRQFKLPKDQICVEAIVKDDRLIAITDKAILCYSLYNSYKLQHLKIDKEDLVYPMKKKLLIMSAYKFKRILYLKSVDELVNDKKSRRRYRKSKRDVEVDSSDSSISSSEDEDSPRKHKHIEDTSGSSDS